MRLAILRKFAAKLGIEFDIESLEISAFYLFGMRKEDRIKRAKEEFKVLTKHEEIEQVSDII